MLVPCLNELDYRWAICPLKHEPLEVPYRHVDFRELPPGSVVPNDSDRPPCPRICIDNVDLCTWAKVLCSTAYLFELAVEGITDYLGADDG